MPCFRLKFELWNRRTELINTVCCTNSAGIHHGDLKPNNVCIDTHGKARIIDWHLAEPCGCEGECMELANLMDDISCDLP
jgi:RIO-like serine/threonine protein kinase